MSHYARFEDERPQQESTCVGAVAASVYPDTRASLMNDGRTKEPRSYGLRPTHYGQISGGVPVEVDALPAYAQAPTQAEAEQQAAAYEQAAAYGQPTAYEQPATYEQQLYEQQLYEQQLYEQQGYSCEEEPRSHFGLGCLARNRLAVSRLTFFLTLFSLVCSCLSLLAATDSPYLIKTFAWGIATKELGDGQCTETKYIGLEHIVREVKCDGDSITVDIGELQSVDEVKARVEEMTGVPPAEQSLVIEGHLLESGKDLADYPLVGTSLLFSLKPDVNAERK